MTDSFEKFFAAIQSEDVADVKQFISDEYNLNALNEHGAPVLYFAVARGNLEIIRLLLENGADVNFAPDEEFAATAYGETALDIAQQMRVLMNWDKYQPVVKLLLKFGAKDVNGETDFAEDYTEEELKEMERSAKEWQTRKKEEN